MSYLEWYRPSEIDTYSDILTTHDNPISQEQQHTLRRAYYSVVTHVDTLIGELLEHMENLKLR